MVRAIKETRVLTLDLHLEAVTFCGELTEIGSPVRDYDRGLPRRYTIVPIPWGA